MRHSRLTIFIINNRALIFLSLLAFLVYFLGLANYPQAFSRDEASVAYNAFSIMKTGRDEWGVPFPLHFKGPGDYPASLAFYLEIPSIFLFGLNEFSARLPAAIFAVLNIIVVIIFTHIIFKNSSLALVSGIILMLSPLEFVSARSGSEVIFAFFFTLLTLIFIIKRKSLVLVLLAAFLCLNSYLATRVYLPLLVGLTLLFFRPYTRKKSIIILMLVGALAATLLTLGKSQIRYQAVSIFSQDISVNLFALNQQDGVVHWPYLISRLLHNKYLYLGRQLVSQTFDFLSPQYLYLSGGFPTRFKIIDVGIMPLITMPFMFIGFLYMYLQHRRRFLYLLSFGIISLIPAIITTEYHPNMRRAYTFLIPLAIISAYGVLVSFAYINRHYRKITRYCLYLVLSLALTLNLAYVLENFVVHNQFAFATNHSSEYRRFVQELYVLKPRYDHIYFTSFADNPYIYLAFYRQLNPILIQSTAATRPDNFKPQSWSLDGIVFVMEDCPINYPGNNLYVGKGDVCRNNKELAPQITLVDSFASPGTPIYDLYTDNRFADTSISVKPLLLQK